MYIYRYMCISIISYLHIVAYNYNYDIRDDCVVFLPHPTRCRETVGSRGNVLQLLEMMNHGLLPSLSTWNGRPAVERFQSVRLIST